MGGPHGNLNLVAIELLYYEVSARSTHRIKVIQLVLAVTPYGKHGIEQNIVAERQDNFSD